MYSQWQNTSPLPIPSPTTFVLNFSSRQNPNDPPDLQTAKRKADVLNLKENLSSGYIPVSTKRSRLSTPAHPHTITPTSNDMSSYDKLDIIYAQLKKFRWSLGDLLYHIFRHESVKEPGHSMRNSAAVSRLLKGQSDVHIGSIIKLMYTHPSGHVKEEVNCGKLGY